MTRSSIILVKWSVVTLSKVPLSAERQTISNSWFLNSFKIVFNFKEEQEEELKSQGFQSWNYKINQNQKTVPVSCKKLSSREIIDDYYWQSLVLTIFSKDERIVTKIVVQAIVHHPRVSNCGSSKISKCMGIDR
ncbi:unnamed protein product [Ambrosiozyma monospora]|uniref:Unnamed protein product n=1 Tax=Ambrosiozyma monospora TaxID=43982 RepID=A0ACB5TNP6_AMBMO|nr:unnamed protein product [Ambrosiozyma monospora]